MPERDLYEILGIPRTATAAEVKSAYRRLAKKYHPDMNPGKAQAEEKFKEVTAAAEVLGDPKRRALYDEFGADSLRSGFDPTKAAEYRQWKRQGAAPGGMPFDFGDFQRVNVGEYGAFDFGTLFEDLFGAQPQPRGRRAHGTGHARHGSDAAGELEVELREAVLGGERDVRVDDRTLRVRIPPGVSDGSTIRLAGQGGAGANGGRSGDVLLKVKLREHPRVRREGKDLFVEVPVTVPEAVLGAEVTLPTFEGAVRVRVPPGSQTGRRLRLRGKGLPDLKGGARGDLYAVLQVVLPAPSEKLEKAVKGLEGLYKEDPRAGLSL